MKAKGGKEKKKRRGEKVRPMGQKRKCSGSMSASDKGISLPPVGQSERLTLQALAHMHTPLYGYQLFCLRLVTK